MGTDWICNNVNTFNKSSNWSLFHCKDTFILGFQSPSVTSVPVKVGIFKSKILGENDHYNHQIIHQLKVKDTLYHSVQYSFNCCEVTD